MTTNSNQGNRPLLFIGNKLAQLRAEMYGPRRAGLVRLHQECERGSAVQFKPEPPNESTTWAGIGIMNRALLYRLTEDPQHLAEAERWMDGAITWQDWGNAHLVNVDLSAAWILWGLALGYDWIKDDMQPELRERTRDKLIRHGRIMFDYIVENRNKSWCSKYWQNHNWIDFNGMATAGYALVDECPEAQAWIDDARENFKHVFHGMADDGSNYEGAVYWRYGVPWLFAYAEMLREREGADYWASSEFLKNTFWYRLYQCVPNLEETFNFGDAHDSRSSTSAMMYMKLASEYRLPEAQYMAHHALAHLYREQYQSGIKPGILPEAGLEFLWYDPSLAPSKDLSHLPLSHFFPDLGLLASRDSWDKDAIMISVKCGHPGGRRQWEQSWQMQKETGHNRRSLSHQHPDNGAILLHAFGSYLVCDDGYNRTLHAREHSVITVNGKGYRDEGANDVWAKLEEDKIARLTEYTPDGKFFVFASDTARCYDESLAITRCERTIGSADGSYFVIFDQVAASKAHQFEWNMQAATPPQHQADHIRYRNCLAGMELWPLAPKAREIANKVTTVRAIFTTQEPDKFHEAIMNTLVIKNAETSTETEFLTVMAPFRIEDGQCAWRFESLACEAGLGLVASRGAQREFWLFNTGSGIASGPLTSDANWVYCEGSLDASENLRRSQR